MAGPSCECAGKKNDEVLNSAVGGLKPLFGFVVPILQENVIVMSNHDEVELCLNLF